MENKNRTKKLVLDKIKVTKLHNEALKQIKGASNCPDKTERMHPPCPTNQEVLAFM